MEKAIEALRYAMQNLAEQYGFLDPRVIEKSQKLDKLIVQYMTRSSPPETEPLKEVSTRETGGHRCHLESIVSLHEEIKDLEQKSSSSSDPLVWKKSRELDELLVAFIHR